MSSKLSVSDDEKSNELAAMSESELETLALLIDEQKSLRRKGADRVILNKDISDETLSEPMDQEKSFR